MVFCINCGEKLVDGARFCHACGTAVAGVPSENKNQRKQEYVGKILKCSNCGAVITEATVICPDCGIHITGREAVSSVQAFKEQLMSIEATREKPRFLDIYYHSANPADAQKLALIRSFPIPNTVDDIQEFILLAIANIDTRLSGNTAASKFSNFMNYGDANLTIQKTISDAWVSKMKQAYQKAEIAFPNDPVFSGIKKIYLDKLKELKIKIL
ncbi:MAG: zinc ribbon domain-containing protein [Bacteroidales bacterium]|nr:zinc ribbon domain-containing protein [Bacteroidales bacterium]